MGCLRFPDSGNWEIYVSTFPAGEGKWQVSRGGGTQPRWRADGKEIFYEGPAGMLTAVPISTESGFSTGTPVSLFQIQGRFQISSTDIFTYDATRDGQRFLINRYVKPDSVRHRSPSSSTQRHRISSKLYRLEAAF